MHSLQEHKNLVEKMIVDTMIQTLKEKKVNESEIPNIADFVLKQIDPIANHKELVQFVIELARKWPFFKNIAMIEQGEEKVIEEKMNAKNILNLIHSGKTQEAISLAQNSI